MPEQNWQALCASAQAAPARADTKEWTSLQTVATVQRWAITRKLRSRTVAVAEQRKGLGRIGLGSHSDSHHDQLRENGHGSLHGRVFFNSAASTLKALRPFRLTIFFLLPVPGSARSDRQHYQARRPGHRWACVSPERPDIWRRDFNTSVPLALSTERLLAHQTGLAWIVR
ncbi:hypothetical protein NUW54_g3031 [Trametes sanguinea]|uniref:Uncharacterized protein n=1 Tax=Trametes sanguinea TaxID=158606 RepID=A0ACC1Q3J2_9APHY|nr:hypothetical protein NUW54_g3031 [Trametes sanguinea]